MVVGKKGGNTKLLPDHGKMPTGKQVTENCKWKNSITKNDGGVGKKANVKLVFRRESNSLFRLQKQWHGLWGIVCYDPGAEKLSNTSTAMTNR